MTQPRKDKLKAYFERNIKDTAPNQSIRRIELHIGRIDFQGLKDIYISSWALKHIYDRRVGFCEVFVAHSYSIVSFPDAIFNNREGKDGEYLFIKDIRDGGVLCVVLSVVRERLYVLTVFPIRSGYLKSLRRVQ